MSDARFTRVVERLTWLGLEIKDIKSMIEETRSRSEWSESQRAEIVALLEKDLAEAEQERETILWGDMVTCQ